jgi:HEAT repeat protein
MRIFFLNSKKCLTCSSLLLLSLISSPAWAAPTPKLYNQIEKELNAATGSQFESLLNSWNQNYGKRALDALIDLAEKKSLDEKKRFIATLGLARVGGAHSEKVIESLHTLLKDKQWLVRMAALRAIAMNQMKDSSQQVMNCLKDPALVVRSEAISTLEVLKPEGSISALVDTIKDPANYHRGKAQWVPQFALSTLAKLKAPKSTALQLKDLLDRDSDPKLLLGAIETFEALHDDRSSSHKPLKDRVQYWKSVLASQTN